jgi:hypothetical protein
MEITQIGPLSAEKDFIQLNYYRTAPTKMSFAEMAQSWSGNFHAASFAQLAIAASTGGDKDKRGVAFLAARGLSPVPSRMMATPRAIGSSDSSRGAWWTWVGQASQGLLAWTIPISLPALSRMTA